MSEIGNELRMLLMLNEAYKVEDKFIKISEFSIELERSERQIRRYRDDLEQSGFYIDCKFGPDGGYRLIEPIDKSLLLPDNLYISLLLASKNNESLMKSLHDLPFSPYRKRIVDGDNFISSHTIDVLSIVTKSINESKSLIFDYEMYEKTYHIEVEPYKVIYTNHTYFLRGSSVYKNDLRKYDVEKIHNISLGKSFTINKSFSERIDNELLTYGVMDNADSVLLELKYFSTSDISLIDRTFECKGIIDKENMIYKVRVKNNFEPFVPIFSLQDKVSIINEDLKQKYKEYLMLQINNM